MSCHEAPAQHLRGSRPTIALVGNPNAGKSTLFNALTGARQTTMNAPGTTVELTTGTWRLDGQAIRVVDLPGTYSLTPRSPDEQVVADYLSGHIARPDLPGVDVPSADLPGAEMPKADVPRPDLCLVLLDATALARSLDLLAHVLSTGLPVVGVVTMSDVASRRAVNPDLEALAAAAGITVVAVNPRTGAGIEALAAALGQALPAASLPESLEPTGLPAPPGSPNPAGPSGPRSESRELALLVSPEARFAWTERVLAAALPGPPSGRSPPPLTGSTGCCSTP
ncbi:MAG: 50S ribosome-binding GTPase, partial [Promicromonosporaceae bacterium]|nr:50S ribosome-binding GTPase [Promicromonosporaceae bacterium]